MLITGVACHLLITCYITPLSVTLSSRGVCNKTPNLTQGCYIARPKVPDAAAAAAAVATVTQNFVAADSAQTRPGHGSRLPIRVVSSTSTFKFRLGVSSSVPVTTQLLLVQSDWVLESLSTWTGTSDAARCRYSAIQVTRWLIRHKSVSTHWLVVLVGWT